MSLKGKRILVTRAKAAASALVLQIQKFGGTPIDIPLIACRPVLNKEQIHEVIDSLHTYNWIVFTSKNGIDFFMEEYREITGQKQLPEKCKIAVVGTKTADVLNDYNLVADLIPEQFVAESLAEKLVTVVNSKDKVLIPRGNLARNVIGDQLRANGILVTELDVYETVNEESSKESLYEVIKCKQVDIVTFTSSSTVDNFVQLLDGTDWRNHTGNILFASIGPITSKTMRKHKLPVHVEAEEYTIPGMLLSMMDKLKEEK